MFVLSYSANLRKASGIQETSYKFRKKLVIFGLYVRHVPQVDEFEFILDSMLS